MNRPVWLVASRTLLIALALATFISCGHSSRRILGFGGKGAQAPTSPAGPAYTRFDESLGIKVTDGAGGYFVVFPVDGRERLIADAKRLYAASVASGTGGAITLTVTNSQPQTLSDAFFYIKYDSARLSPTACAFGDGIAGRQMLTLALTDQRDVLPAGFAGIHGATVSLAAGAPVLTATFANRPFASSKRASSVVTGSENQVQDWRVTTNPDNTVTYEWTQRLVGDYNSDGMVGITDLVPVAQLYGDKTNDNQVNATATSWTSGEILNSRDDELGWLRWDYDAWDRVADGNGDKEVGIGDLQPLANHYGETIQGYDAYFGNAKVYAAGQSGLMPSIATPMTLGTTETGATMVANPDLPRLFKMTFTPGSGTGLSAMPKQPSDAAPINNGLIPVDGAGNQGRSDSWLKHIIDVTAVVDSLTRTVQYTIVVDPSADSYLWDFDDGTTSTEQNPTHTFAADGDYFVTVTITDKNKHILHALPKLTLAAAAPWAPTNLAGTVNGVDVSLTWTPSTDPAVTSYDVWYAVTPNDANPARFNSPTQITAPPATIPGALVPGAIFLYYRVTAIKPVVGGKMESDYSNEWHNAQGTDTMPPTWIGLPGIQAAAPGDATVTVTWGTAVDAQTPPVHYTLYWAQEPVAPSTFFTSATKIADVTSPYVFGTHPGETPVNGTAYRFGVRASDSVAPTPNEDQNMVSLTATPGDYVPPVWDSTVGITGATPGAGQVTVTWGTATDATSPPVTYNIYYSRTSPIDFPTANRISGIPNNPTGTPPTNSYVVGSLTNGVTYYFAVRTVDSAPSHNEDTNFVTLSATPPLPSVSGTVTLSGEGGLAGAMMTLTPGGLTTTTQADGTYSITNVPGGSYTLTPSKPYHRFTPPSRPVTVSGADVTGQDFTAYTGLADTPWPKFHKDELNSGRADSLGPVTNSVLWTFQMDTGGGVTQRSSPAVGSDGTVYIGSGGKRLYAVSSSGTLVWSVLTGGSIDQSPAVAQDGTIYIGSHDDKLYAINPDGSTKWTFPTANAITAGGVAIGPDGTVYTGSDDGYLYAINASNGSMRWKFSAGYTIRACPAIDDAGTVYVGSDYYVYAVNASDGSMRWFNFLGDTGLSSPALGDALWIGNGKSLYSLSLAEGQGSEDYRGTNFVYSSPALGVDGTIYFGGDNYVRALGKWAFAAGGLVLSSPAIGADGTVYVGCDDRNVYALNGADGSVIWSYQTGDAIRTAPAIVNGRLYVAADDGKLYAFGP